MAASHKIVYNNCYGGFSLSEEAETWLHEHGVSKEEIEEFVWNDRHNPTLVKCVEALGRRASGECSKLAIAEIDSDKYRITEYDGWETVEVPEDLAWIVIS